MKIIILHGLYMRGLFMQPLSHKLAKLGYETQVLTYNTVAIDSEKLYQTIDTALSRTTTNILVGHSLGGLIIKNYLKDRKPSLESISHVVTIGSPLQGASIVERIKQLGLIGLLGNSTEHGLALHGDRWDLEQKLGSIAGTLPIGVRRLLMMDNSIASDGTVTLDETKIDGMTDHIQSSYSHTSLIYSVFVPKQIDQFIRYDHFLHDA